MSRMADFSTILEDLHIDPERWADARAAEGEFAEYLLAKEVESIVIADIKGRRLPLAKVQTTAMTLAAAADMWPTPEDVTEPLTIVPTAA